MKHILILIYSLVIFLDSWGQESKDMLVEVRNAQVVWEQGERYFVSDIYLTLRRKLRPSNFLLNFTLTFNFDKEVFEQKEVIFGNNALTFTPHYPGWGLVTNYDKPLIGIRSIADMWFAEISYKAVGDDAYPETDDIELPVNEAYFFGTIKWRLLSDASKDKAEISFRDETIDNANACGAVSIKPEEVTLEFSPLTIEFDIPDNPLIEVEKPTDLMAGNLICGTPSVQECSVTRPESVDSCVWYISTDQAGKEKVGAEIAEIVTSDYGAKASINWKKRIDVGNYYIQVYSAKGVNQSNPISQNVRVEDFPGFEFDRIAETIDCRSTELTWNVPEGMTWVLYDDSYKKQLESPYTYADSDINLHFVRYRELNTCKDTTDYKPSFLDPRIEWLQKPPATVQRGESLTALVDEIEGVPVDYDGVNVQKYIWLKPDKTPEGALWQTEHASLAEYEFEVYANVDGCLSDTLTGITTVTGGGLKPSLSTGSGKTIACKDGGILLTTSPEGGSGDYSYKWYAEGAEDDILGTEREIWVSPTVETVYHVEIEDNISKETVSDKITITYQDIATPVVSAGEDLSILKGEYTWLHGEIVAEGTSDTYQWKWQPAQRIVGNAEQQNVQTANLEFSEKYNVFVVDGNGCMSKPDSVDVVVVDELDPELKPDEEDDFALNVVPDHVTLCRNNSVQLELVATGVNLEDAVYQWMPETGLDNANIENPILTATEEVVSSDYFVKVSKGNLSIIRKVKVDIRQDAAPKLELADNRMACSGDVVEVVCAEGTEIPDKYVWVVDGEEIENNQSTLPLSTLLGEHSIVIYGVNDNGCTSDTISTNVNVQQGVKFAGVTPDVTICGNETALSFESVAPEETAFKWLAPNGDVISDTENTITVVESGEYRLVGGEGFCADTTKIQVVLNNVLAVEGLRSLVTGCEAMAELAFETTTAPSFVWLDPQKQLLPDSQDKNPFTVTEEGTYYLALDGTDCRDTLSVSVVLNQIPILADILPELTTCDNELSIAGLGVASAGEIRWATDPEGNSLVEGNKLTGTGTQTYYVFADAGEGCRSQIQEVQVSFGTSPELIVDTLQTACGETYRLRASTTGTGEVKWYDSEISEHAIDPVVTASAGQTREYWACAEDAEGCKSERVKVAVKFGVSPILTVEPILTVCGTEIELTASTTGGRVVWLDMEGNELLITKITGEPGEVRFYQVYAKDETCSTPVQTVEVRFGSNPVIMANDLYTSCGNEFVLTAETSAGELTWYSDAAGEHELTSLIVNKGDKDIETYYVQAVDGDCRSEMTPIRVAFGSNPLVEALPLQTSCDSEGALTLRATTTGGTLVWENSEGVKLPSPQVTESGFYYVYAEDGACRSTKEEVKVEFGADPQLTVATYQTSCVTEYTLHASTSGGIVKWYADERGEQEISPVVSGSVAETKHYWAKAIDGSCESSLTEVRVKFGAQPELTVEEDVTSCEEVVKLEAVTTGGILIWTDETGRELPVPQVTGVAGTSAKYTVKAVDGVCESSPKQVTVHFGTKPTIKVEPLQTACGSELTLEASAAEGASIVWLDSDKETPLEDTFVTGTGGTTAVYWVYAEQNGCRSDMQEVHVAFGELPVVSVVSPQTTCGTSLTLAATASGGEVVWTTQEDDVLEDLTIHGSNGTKEVYYVKAVDGECQSAAIPVEVSFGTIPEIIVEQNQTVCGEETELVATSTDPSATIYWLDSEHKPLVTNVVTGASGSSKEYYVYAESTGSCRSEEVKVTVHFGSEPTLIVTPITSCDTIANLVASSSVSDLIWTDASGKELVSTQVHGAAGTTQVYYVQAKDASCYSQKEAVSVSFGKNPELKVEPIQTVCSGSQYELQASATGNSVVVWYQSDGETPLTSTTINKGAGNSSIYYVEAVDGTCSSEKVEVTVLFDQAPILTLEKPLQTTCGESLTLEASTSAGELVWTDVNGEELGLPQVSGVPGESYYYYVYAKDGSCESDRKAVEVRFGEKPTVIVEPVLTTCGTSVTLSGEASDGLLHWLASNNKEDVLESLTVTGEPGTEKTYYVYASNGEGCESEILPVKVLFGASPVLTEVLTPQTTCGTSIQLEATATAGIIEWRNAMGILLPSPWVTREDPGEDIYYVQAVDGECVSASQEVVVKFGAKPEIIYVPEQTACGTSHELIASASQGIVHYLDTDRRTELSSAVVTGEIGTFATYYLYAAAPECVGDTVPVKVTFGAKPIVKAESPQTTCENMIVLQATTSFGELYWENKDNQPLATAQVTPEDGNLFYVYAEDGGCSSSGKVMVNVSFGTKPTITVEDFQTTCEADGYELQAEASAGAEIHWLDSDGITPLESSIVSGEVNTLKTYWVYASKDGCRSDLKEVTVAFGVAPIVTVRDTFTSCGTSVTLSAETSAGSLKWEDEDGDPLENLTVNNMVGSPMTYYVYAVDGACTSVKHKVVVQTKRNPSILADQLQTSCDNTHELQAVATDGELYWLDGNMSPMESNIVSGTTGKTSDYYVYAQQGEGSCISDTVKISVKFGTAPLLDVESPQTACGEGEVIIDLQASTTGGKLVWENDAHELLATTQQKENAGTVKYYYVRAVDGSCSSTTELVEARFGASPLIFADTLQTACGESLALQADASNGSVEWYTGEKVKLESNVVNASQGDIYYVKAVDGACNSDFIAIRAVFETSPLVEAVSPQTTCGNLLKLEAQTSGGSLVWEDANGNILDLPQVGGNPQTSAIYYVYAVDAECQSPKQAVEARFGVLPEVLAETEQTACGTTHQLVAAATEGELVWLNDRQELLSSPTVTGNIGESKEYYVYAKTADCEGEKLKITVHFGQLPKLTVAGLQTTCENSLVLEASASAGSLIWTNEEGEVLATPTVTGNPGENAYYYVTAQDGSCQSTTERVEVRFGTKPEVLLSSDVFTTCDEEYTLEAKVTDGVAVWFASNGTTPLTSTTVYKPVDSDRAEYYVQAMNGAGCVGEKHKVTVVFNSGPILSVTTPQTTCDSVITLTAETSGGALVWMNKDKEELVSAVVKGEEGTTDVYYVKAVDGACVSEVKEVTVAFGSMPAVNVLAQQTACGTKLELQASASGGDLFWLDENKTPLASSWVEGIENEIKQYYVYAVSGLCVSDTLPVEVAFGQKPKLEVADIQTSCGDVVELQASATGGTLQWTTENGEIILPPVLSRADNEEEVVVYVQAIDETCSSDKVPVKVKFGTLPQVIVEQLQTSCDTVHTLTAIPTAGELVWEDENNDLLVSPHVHGQGIKTYYVRAVAGEGCESERVKVQVAFGSAPIVRVADLQTSCGDELQLKASTTAGQLIWTDAEDTPLQSTIVRESENGSGIYYVYAQDGECRSHSETVEVRFNTTPVVTVEPLQVTCGTEYTLRAETSCGELIWLDSKGSKPIAADVNSAMGNPLKVHVYAQGDEEGCVSEPIMVTVQFNTKPDFIDLQSQQIACETPYKLQARANGGQIIWKTSDGVELPDGWAELKDGENKFFAVLEDASCKSSTTQTVSVTLGSRPELVLTETHCIGDSIYAEEMTGMSGLTYHWKVNGIEQEDFTGNAYVFRDGGSYEVEVTAESEGGCMSEVVSASYEIDAPVHLAWEKAPLESIEYGLPLGACAKVAEGETEGISWEWISPAGFKNSCVNVRAIEPEYYFQVYVKTKNGCFSDTLSALTIVEGFGELELALESESGSEICKGGSALLTATVTGGQAPYTYEWFVKGTTVAVRKVTTTSAIDVLEALPLEDVTYVVKVRDAQNIPAIASQEVALTVREDAEIPVADAGPDMTVEKGLQTVLRGAATGSVVTWNWVPVDKLANTGEAGKQYPQTIALESSQRYRLYVTGANGCVSRPDEMIAYVLPLDGTDPSLPEPPSKDGLELAIYPQTDTLCLGTEVWISVKDLLGNLSEKAVYTWSPEEKLTFNEKKDSALFVPESAGDYEFTVFVEDGGKQMGLRSRIHVRDVQAPVFDLAVSGSCQNDTVKVNWKVGSPEVTELVWKVKGQQIANTEDYYVLTLPGTYQVEVSALNGECSSLTKSVDVTVNRAPVISNLAIVDSCGRAVLELTADGATEYWWTLNEGEEVAGDTRFTIEEAGAFEVTVRASNGTCDATTSLSGEVYERPVLADWITEPVDTKRDGSIQAAVNAQGGHSPYTYHWLQPDEAAEETTGAYTLTPAILASYTFEVYAEDDKGCVSDTLIKTVSVSGGDVQIEVHSVYGDEICQGGAAMLVAHAKGVELPCTFKWAGPVKRQITKAVPYDTLWINDTQAGFYTVSVAKGSEILARASLETTLSADKTAPQLTVESVLTIPSGGQTVLPATATGGTPDYNWHWSPADKLAVAADTSIQYPLTTKLTAPQDYLVYVTDAASCVSRPATTKVDISEYGLQVAIQPAEAEICLGNKLTMRADVIYEKQDVWYPEYAWLPAENSGLLDANDQETAVFTPIEAGDYTWVVRVQNGDMIALAKAVVKVQDAAAPVLALEGRSDCVNDTLIVKNSGEPVDRYVWHVDGLEIAESSDRLILDNAAIKHVSVYAVAANGCQSDSLTTDLQLGIVPDVQIAGGPFVCYPDSTRELKVKQTDGLTSGEYTFAWTSEPADKLQGATDGLTALTAPMTEDVKYTVTVTSNVNEACRASDTVWGYLIPHTAPVEIRKDEATGNLELAWSQDDLGLADSVRVMGIKWDGYAVLSSYQPRAMAEGANEKFTLDTSKDTLEFFYINASRYIKALGRSYYSLPSDTVGYFRQWVYADAKASTQQNFIGYPFAMDSIKTTGDIIKYAGFNNTGKYALSTVAYWSDGSWRAASATSSNIIGSANNVPVVLGSVYRLILRDELPVQLLFYGKLPSPFEYVLSGDNTNFILVPLSMGCQSNRYLIGDLIPEVNSIGSYMFKEQSWKTSTKSSAGIWGGTTGDFNVNIWRVLRVILKGASEDINWKY